LTIFFLLNSLDYLPLSKNMYLERGRAGNKLTFLVYTELFEYLGWRSQVSASFDDSSYKSPHQSF